MNENNEKILLTVQETAEYLNMGMTKTREIMKQYESVFVVMIGKKKYSHKALLDKWLLGQVVRPNGKRYARKY